MIATSNMGLLPGHDRQTPDVSIIMSAFNDDRWLVATIDAVLAQTSPNFEFLIIDDASTDTTPDIFSKYRDPRIKFIRHDVRNGWMNNINKLAQMASGRLLKLQCPDDVMGPQSLQRAMAFFADHPEVGYIISDFYLSDEAGARIGEGKRLGFAPVTPGRQADVHALNHGCFANTSCIYVPRDRWLEVGGLRDVTKYNPARLPNVEDFDLLVRLQGRYPVGYIDAQLVAVRIHTGQVQVNPTGQLLACEGGLFVLKTLAQRIGETGPEARDRARSQLLAFAARAFLQAGIRDIFRGQVSNGLAEIRVTSDAIPLRQLLRPWLATALIPYCKARMRRLFAALPRLQ